MKTAMVTTNGDALKGEERSEFGVRRISSEKRNVLKHKEGWILMLQIGYNLETYNSDEKLRYPLQ